MMFVGKVRQRARSPVEGDDVVEQGLHEDTERLLNPRRQWRPAELDRARTDLEGQPVQYLERAVEQLFHGFEQRALGQLFSFLNRKIVVETTTIVVKRH